MKMLIIKMLIQFTVFMLVYFILASAYSLYVDGYIGGFR